MTPKNLVFHTHSAEDLVMRALKGCKPKRLGPAARWVAVRDTFGFGSTYSVELCCLFGLNPDEVIRGVHCDVCDSEDT